MIGTMLRRSYGGIAIVGLALLAALVLAVGHTFPPTNPCEPLIKRHRRATIPLVSLLTSRLIDQHTPHQSRAQTVKMVPVFKSEATLPDQSEEQLVHGDCRLQDSSSGFAPEQSACDPS